MEEIDSSINHSIINQALSHIIQFINHQNLIDKYKTDRGHFNDFSYLISWFCFCFTLQPPSY